MKAFRTRPRRLEKLKLKYQTCKHARRYGAQIAGRYGAQPLGNEPHGAIAESEVIRRRAPRRLNPGEGGA